MPAKINSIIYVLEAEEPKQKQIILFVERTKHQYNWIVQHYFDNVSVHWFGSVHSNFILSKMTPAIAKIVLSIERAFSVEQMNKSQK